jgi:hypothetical protein
MSLAVIATASHSRIFPATVPSVVSCLQSASNGCMQCAYRKVSVQLTARQPLAALSNILRNCMYACTPAATRDSTCIVLLTATDFLGGGCCCCCRSAATCTVMWCAPATCHHTWTSVGCRCVLLLDLPFVCLSSLTARSGCKADVIKGFRAAALVTD